MDIVTTPDSILAKKAPEVKHFDKKLKNLISEMSDTLNKTTDPIGVGLAAPQVGISERLFLAKPKEDSKIMVVINPVIVASTESTKTKKTKKRLLEGCLSIPNIWGHVTRKKTVTVEYQDELGKPHKKIFTGFLATIMQHEIDHLDGILFTKHVLAQNEKLYRSFKNDRGEEEFEEVKI